jgi:hypothetical protein
LLGHPESEPVPQLEWPFPGQENLQSIPGRQTPDFLLIGLVVFGVGIIQDDELAAGFENPRRLGEESLDESIT